MGIQNVTKNEKDLKPLIDGDPVIYRAGFSADNAIKRPYLEANPGASPEEVAEFVANEDYIHHALGNVKTFLESITERFNPEYKLFVHGGGNFRDKVATIKPYKGNRDRNHVPKYKNEIYSYMCDVWNAYSIRGMESDDAICIEQHRNTDKYSVIVSIDKDILNGMYGWSYNPMRDELKFTTPQEANNFFFWQMLVGDTSDNIPGINRIGPKKASAVIEAAGGDTDKVREAVKSLYQKQYGEEWERAYREVGTLLYILRRPEELDKGCPLL
jgi:DNA polymerase-1